MEQRGTEGAYKGQQIAEVLSMMLGLNDVNANDAPSADNEMNTPGELSEESNQEWLSVQSASRYIHVSPSTVYRLIREGKLPSHRVRRRILINREALEACIKDGLLA